MLYPSTMFRLNGIDPQRAGKAWEVIPKLMLQAEAEGRYKFPRKTPIVRPQKSGIEWRVNLTQLANREGNAMDGTDARELSEAEVLGRRRSPTWPASCAKCPASRTATSSTSRRRSASARRAGCAASTS
jgi:hypothetical protein